MRQKPPSQQVHRTGWCPVEHYSLSLARQEAFVLGSEQVMHCQNRSRARESSHVLALLVQINGPFIWCFIAACTLFITSLHSLANNKHFFLNSAKISPHEFSCIYSWYFIKKKIKKLSRGEKERCDYKKRFKNSSLKNKHPFIYSPSNQYALLSSPEHKRRSSAECSQCAFPYS